MNNVFEQLTENDLTPDLQLLADTCGMQTVIKLLENFAGLNFYIPKISRLEPFVERYLKQNSQKSIKVLARELGVSEQYLKNMEKRCRKIRVK
jgi:hypothetical protein